MDIKSANPRAESTFFKSIAQNSGQREFVLDTQAVQAPDKLLSEWVVASYRSEQPVEKPTP
jgi:hypothetical protein